MHLYKASLLGHSLTVIIGSDYQCQWKNGFAYQHLDKRIEKVLEIQQFIHCPVEVVINIDADGTCAETLRLVSPSVFAKGGEYSKLNMPTKELQVCREIGCHVIFNVGSRLCSSSDLHSLLAVKC